MLTLGGRTKKVGKEQKDKITPKKVERGKKMQKLLEQEVDPNIIGWTKSEDNSLKSPLQ